MQITINRSKKQIQGTILLSRTFFGVLFLSVCIGGISSFYAPSIAHASTLNAPSNYLALNAGLVGWWTFDGKTISGTTAADSSGYGNSGTLTNGPTQAIGKSGQALAFTNSKSQEVVIPNVTDRYDNTSTLSVFAWVKMDTGSSYGFVSKRTNSSSGYSWAMFNLNGSSNLSVDIGTAGGGGDTRYTSTGTLSTGTWHLIGFVFDGTQVSTSRVKIYIDGALDSTQSSSQTTIPGNTSNVEVGILGGNVSYYMNGSIDDVRIYNRALSANEVQQLYGLSVGLHTNTSVVGSNSLSNGLIGWWTMDGKTISGTTLADQSGNGNSGTLTNGPTPTIGTVGQALKLSGGNQYVQLNNSTVFENDSSAHSVSFWVYINSFNTDQYPVILNLLHSGGNRGYYISNQGSYEGISFNYSGTNSFRAAGVSSSLVGKWAHVAIVFDGVSVSSMSSWKVYIDGVSKTISAGGAWGSHAANYIGSDTSSSDYLDGKLDDVRIYNRALSATEVQQLYTMGSGVHADTSVVGSNNLNSNLVGWWTMDGKTLSSTTVTDISGNGNTGTLVNGPTPAIGRVGQALSFSYSKSQYVNLGSNSALKPTDKISVAAWIKATSEPDTYPQIVTYGNNTDGYNLYLYQQYKPAFIVNDNGWGNCWALNTSMNLVDGRWHHLVGTYGGTLISLYVDGTLAATSSCAGLGISYGGTYAAIGRKNYGDYFNGTIDDARIYHSILSAADVKTLYNIGR